MSIPARSVSSSIAIAVLSAGAAAQPVPTPEDEVIAMLREWRAYRAARDAGPVPEAPVEAPGSVVRIRVGGNVQRSALTSGSQPDYPQEARAKGIEGVVTLEAVIGADGAVESVSAIGGDPLLVPAALESVKTWTYRPTLLNGVPVEVLTQIEVSFTLQEEGIPRPIRRKKR